MKRYVSIIFLLVAIGSFLKAQAVNKDNETLKTLPAIAAQEDFMPTNQLLYGATGLPYPGKGTFRNILILWNQVDFQIGRNFVAGAGIILPGELFTIRLQAKISIGDLFHIGITNQTNYRILGKPRYKLSKQIYSMLTVGDYEKFINFSVGSWERFNDWNPHFTDIFLTIGIAGSYTINKEWRIYAEALAFFKNKDELYPAFGIAKRKGSRMFELSAAILPDNGGDITPLFVYTYAF